MSELVDGSASSNSEASPNNSAPTNSASLNSTSVDPELAKPALAKQILVVDDDKNFCKVVALTFQDHEFETFMAFEGETALKIFKEKRPPIVLLDIAMPGMNGFQVAEEIRKLEDPTKRTLIVIMTAHARSFLVSQDFEAKIDSYLTKPILPADILSHVLALV